MLMTIKLMLGKSFIDITASVLILSQLRDLVLEQIDMIILGVTITLANMIILILYRTFRKAIVMGLEWLRKHTPKKFHKHIETIERKVLKGLAKQIDGLKDKTEEDIRNAYLDDDDDEPHR